MNRAPNYVKRLLVAILLAVAFIFMASVFDPDPSGAGEAGPRVRPTIEPGSTDPHAGLKMLGSLQNERYQVRMYATALGPRYSVYDSAGRLLTALRSAEQVEGEFPDLPLPVLESDTPDDDGAPSQIMKAIPHDGD